MKKSNRRKRDALTPEKIELAFTSCARCSYFVAAYRLLHSDWEEAVGRQEDGVITLQGDFKVRRLLAKSYGADLDKGSYYYAGCCRECRRPFEAHIEDGGQPAALHMQIVW